ncbi:MAG TPA: MSMEG_0567/Sll0786 family nitrogen starvation N-acetyltransferase [Nocardioides sp.]|uniref:MSMEG_0567/Sll0786 family nitrogen starvation N-acetyltransferase n=1 Tax=Nocardioides sp. TaxID=35761 RepID=UPI002E2F80E6|nr:MSMEG_0567/Sll0786 family nitrogen starvation N-acetyltransferase [Nocardioides sp.]HEX5087766.1 MSMEG_0567/Sll0786 family nitrogen starvation N-acetyltransferase [Nocardioides sp.]
MQADRGLEAPALAARTGIVCTRARTASERADHLAIRHQVFVDEQGVFGDSDLDKHDRDRSTVALIAYCDEVVVGTVRLFQLDPAAGTWQGDRLAVLAPYRTRGVGAPLVRCAVATAATLGGRVMTAHIQLPNVDFFERLGWTRTGGTELYAGLPHQPMRIVLPSRSEALALVKRLEDGVNERGQ